MAKLSSSAVDSFLAKGIGLAQRMQFSYDPDDLVRVGNRWVPRMIRVELPGGGSKPSTELKNRSTPWRTGVHRTAIEYPP